MGRSKGHSHGTERVLHIISQYHPATVAVRYQEPKGRSAGNAGRKRARIEGVILEASNSKALPVVTGALVTISANLKTKAPFVSDFGQSRKMNSGAVSVPKMYFDAMPPETLNYSVATVQSDVYQIGLLLYRAVNGRVLSNTARRKKRSPTDFRNRKRKIP